MVPQPAGRTGQRGLPRRAGPRNRDRL